MVKGASVRVNKETSGLRFSVWYGDLIDAALRQTYSTDLYEYKLYIEVQRTGTNSSGKTYSKTWIGVSVKDATTVSDFDKEWDDNLNTYQAFSAALNFGGLTATQFAQAKAWEITSKAFVVLSGIAGTEVEEQKFYFDAQENDNVRSMQAVANAAIVAGENPEFINQLEGMPFVDTTVVSNPLESGVIETAEGAVNSLPAFGINKATAIYFGAKKLHNAYLANGRVYVDVNEITSLEKGDRSFVSIFSTDGKIYNVPFVYADKAIRTSSDFKLFYAADGTTISGYYAMANDIKLDGTWTGNTCGSDSPRRFAGTFDGNGHFAEIALKRYGIFGTIGGTSTNPAVIKDAAFIVKQVSVVDFAYASILAYRLVNATVSNCYFEYDLPEGTKIDTAYYGWGQSCGLGIYATPAVEVRFNNVIINTSKVETECKTYEQPFSFGSIATKADSSSSGAYVTKTTDVYVISTNKYMSYFADVTASNNQVSSFNGIRYAWFASNDTEAYEQCEVAENGGKSRLAGTKRYDNFTAFADDAENNNYSSFDAKIWNTTKGYPEFNSITEQVQEEYVKANTQISIGGSTTATEVSLEKGTDKSSTSIIATYNGNTYMPIDVASADSNIVSVENNVITAVEFGTTTVSAYFFIEGIAVEKTFTINVDGPVLTAELRYSTLTNELFVANNKFAISSIKSIVNYGDEQIVYYANGELTSAVIKNYTNEELEDITTKVVVELEDGLEYIGSLVSYTMVINEDTDLDLFNEANYATYSAEGHAYAPAYDG
ncbi:MAG: hypothetical protein J6R83_03425, partial [Clostridia bacterium]|nr:hypothetical protein [Clostridia bacterium]